jgi:group I intron endonuclease
MQYVGKTASSLASRWSQHKYCAKIGSNGFLHRAVAKYGPDAFVIEQIDTAASLKELGEKEIQHISRLNSTAPNGYNLTAGGDGVEMTAQVRAKLAQACTGWSHTEEAKRKISQNHRQNYQAMPKEVAEKISKTLKNKPQKLTCRRGHPFDNANTYVAPSTGARYCLTCHYLSSGQKIPEKLRCYV